MLQSYSVALVLPRSISHRSGGLLVAGRGCPGSVRPCCSMVRLDDVSTISYFTIIRLLIDLRPGKPFQQCPLTWWIFVPSVIQIPPPSEEISHRTKWMLIIDNGRPAG